MKKSKLGTLILVCVLSISALFLYMQKEPYSTEAVMDSIWNKYNIQSTQLGEDSDPSNGEPLISIDVYDKNDIPRVEKHLEKNLFKEDFDYYKISVFLYESTEEPS